MSGSLNRCCFIGNLGADPEIRNTQGGTKLASFRIACTETWNGRDGQKNERTEWVPVVCFNEGLVSVIERYVKKGSKVYVEGKFQTRKWQDQSGADRYTTEVVMPAFGAQLVLLGDPGGGRSGYRDDPGPGSYSEMRGGRREPERGRQSEMDYRSGRDGGYEPSRHRGYDQPADPDLDDPIPF